MVDTVKTLSDMESQIRSQFNIRIRKGFIRRPIQLVESSSLDEEIEDVNPRHHHDLTAVLEDADPNVSCSVVVASERRVEKYNSTEKPKVSEMSKPRTVIPIVRNFSASDDKRHQAVPSQSLLTKDSDGGLEPIQRRSYLFKYDL